MIKEAEMRPRLLLSLLLFFGSLLLSCGQREPVNPTAALPSAETPITEIALAGALAEAKAELSGMAWYGDTLIFLPQYPFFSGEGSFLYALPKSDILAYLDGGATGPLTPQTIPFDAAGLSRQIQGFEGYEAIAFAGETVFLTVEAQTPAGMRGYLVSGEMGQDGQGVLLETAVLPEILPQTNIDNMTDEALLVVGDNLLTFYEANGQTVNQSPMAHRFTLDLQEVESILFPALPFRVTDATEVDENGRFWVINYYYPGDKKLQTDGDGMALPEAAGATHLLYEQVERLVELQLDGDALSLTDTPPLYLQLPDENARNWEGIVRLDGRGFLLVTDKFPETMFAFVPWPP